MDLNSCYALSLQYRTHIQTGKLYRRLCPRNSLGWPAWPACERTPWWCCEGLPLKTMEINWLWVTSLLMHKGMKCSCRENRLNCVAHLLTDNYQITIGKGTWKRSHTQINCCGKRCSLTFFHLLADLRFILAFIRHALADCCICVARWSFED